MRMAARCISSLMLTGAALPVPPVSLSALCPKPKGDEIVVCARPDERSRYEIPLPRLAPEFGSRASNSVSRERNSLFAYDAGGSGLCSTVGPGGMFGCAFKDFKADVEQRANARDGRGWVYQGSGE